MPDKEVLKRAPPAAPHSRSYAVLAVAVLGVVYGDIVTDTDDATIVAAVMGMGKNLKQRVIAEGVETHEQLACLRTQRCDQGQGFHFSRSLSADDFGLLLKVGNLRSE